MSNNEQIVRASLDIQRRGIEEKQKIQNRLDKGKKGKKGKNKKRTYEDLKKEINMTEHLETIKALCERVPESNIDVRNPELSQGLSEEEAVQRLKTNGPNRLTPVKQKHWLLKLLGHFTGFFSLLLLFGSALCFVAFGIELGTFWRDVPARNPDPNNAYLGGVLLIVVCVTSVFTWLQESKSEAMMEGFKNLIPEKTTVVRDGKKSELDASLLVVGDVVEMKYGVKIPADCRIIYSKGFKVDNSSLTGESDLQERKPECSDKNPLETQNLVFFGTFAKVGVAYGIVLLTGDNTMIGGIAGLAASAKSEETPLHHEINRFIYIISAIAMFLGFTFLIIGAIKNVEDYVNNLIFTIGIIVANVPEGLLATVTVSLTLTAKRMSNKKVLVKNLESVETLGSTTTIASDKTGTLTQNRMTVAHIWYDDTIFECATNKSAQHGFDVEDPTFFELQRVNTLCNNATFDSRPENMRQHVLDRKCNGDASESALVKFCDPLRDILEYRKSNEKLGEIPFNSVNKWQLSIHAQEEERKDKRRVLVMKGAPERILALCTKMMIDGEEEDLDDAWRKKYDKAYKQLGSYGERVLGMAIYYFPLDKYGPDFEFDCEKMDLNKNPLKCLTFVGLTALIDPPREGVPEAVEKCKSAGIRVIMVTGDHPETAKAIAKQVGIIEGDTAEDIAAQMGCTVAQVPPERAVAEVIHGKKIPFLQKSDWDRILSKRQIVFARTSPQQKLIIVENCQNRGEVVAVTGDGVNDSPALKRANIGVAMGIGGSDVSKEAADMILMDDNFASIVNGVEEGRLIFDNLKKSIAYTLSSNIPEITPFIFFIVSGIPLPLGTVLILCVDLGTDMIPAISLAYENAESDIMRRPPRNGQTDNLVTAKLIGFAYFQIGVIQACAGFFTYFVVMADHGFPPYILGGQSSNFHFLPSGSEPVRDITGKILNHKQQAEILGKAQGAFFISIIIVQWADLLICKTRKLSLFQQGMKNLVMLFGLLSETLLGLGVIYLPWVGETILGSRPLDFVHFLPGVPFSIFIFLYDEVRKLVIRNQTNGWIERHTYW